MSSKANGHFDQVSNISLAKKDSKIMNSDDIHLSTFTFHQSAPELMTVHSSKQFITWKRELEISRARNGERDTIVPNTYLINVFEDSHPDRKSREPVRSVKQTIPRLDKPLIFRTLSVELFKQEVRNSG